MKNRKILLTLFVCVILFCIVLYSCSNKDSNEDSIIEEVSINDMVFPNFEVASYPFMEGTSEENEIQVITSEEEGPTIFIVGGIHGNEVAGWIAANELKDEIEIGCGTLYILSPLNKSGAELNTRYPKNSSDINRAFPGDVASNDLAIQIAGNLYNEIEKIKPDLVLDLHEALVELGKGTSNAGMANTIIYTLEEPISNLLFDFIYKNQKGELCDREYALTTPGVEGSFNRVISDQLNIPVITVETWRELEIDERVKEQKEIVIFCLNEMGMISRIRN